MTANQTDTIVLVPVHRPKTSWLVSFLNSLALYDVPDHARIMLIASDRADFDYFAAALSYHPLSKHLMVLNATDWVATHFSNALLQRLQENTEGAIINLKKMIGLHWALQSGAHYALCLDSDVLAVAGVA